MPEDSMICVFHCSKCGNHLDMPESMKGWEYRCPECGWMEIVMRRTDHPKEPVEPRPEEVSDPAEPEPYRSPSTALRSRIELPMSLTAGIWGFRASILGLGMIAGMTLLFSEGVGREMQEGNPLAYTMGGAGLLGLGAGLILALAGMYQMLVSRSYATHGRISTLAGLVVSGGMAVFVGSSLDELPWGGKGDGGEVVSSGEQAGKPDSKAGQATGRGKKAFQSKGSVREALAAQLNFTCDHPGKGWSEFDVTQYHPDAVIGYIRKRPEIALMITATRMGVESKFTNDDGLKMVQEELRGKYLHITFGDVSPIVVNDVAGLEFLATQTQVGTPMNYIIWLASVNGYFYQVYVYASAKVPLRTLKKTVEEGQCCFALLDPDKVAHVKGGGTSVGRIASRIFGYSADLSGTPWALWKGGDGDLSHAEFAFCFGETRFFGVFPLDLGRVEPDRAALCKALLYFLSMDDRRIALYKVGPVRIGALRGFSCRYSAKFGRKKREYLMTVVRQGPVALLLGGWSTIGVEGVEDLRRAFQRFRFDQTSPMVEDRNTWSEKLKEAHHQALHEMAVSYSRRGNAHLAEIYFRRALEFGVTDLALKNLYWILSAGERYGDALKVLDRFKAAVDGSPALRMARAFLLSKLGRLDEAFGIYRSVFDGGFRSDKGFLHYFVFLCEAQGLEAGVSAALRYMKGGDSILVAAGVARVLVIERKEKRAIEVMTSLWRRSGLNSILYNLINALMDKGFFAEVVSVCRLLEENGDDSAFVPFSRGKAEFVQKLFLKARVSFETALRRSPDEEEIQRYLAVVKMKLGQGETNLVDAVVEPVAIPAEDLAVSTGKKLPERYGRCDAYLDTRIMAVAYEKDKAYRESEFKRIVVRTGLGARRLNTLSFSFNPLFEKLYCNYLVVKDMNGKVLARSNRADWYVLDAGGGEASNRKILHIPVPGLRPDCAIELCVTRSNLYPPSSFPLTRMVFSSSLPCVRASLLLMGSRKGLRERIRGDIVRSDGEDYIRWSLDHPKTIPAEPYAVSPYAYLPSLVLWDETNTWNSEVCSYLDMIGHRLAPSSEVEAKAAELTRGLRTAEEKMEVLARYVQKTLSYKAISFGLRGLIPKACEKTMLDRYGDCKAHAVLLHALLRAAGISSSLVLVDSGKSVMPDIAHAGQFNHMILYLPDSRGGGRFVDPVVKSLNLLTSPPPGLSGCKVLVVDRKTRGLRTIPDPSPERDAVHLKRKVRIIREGTLEVRETMTLTGVCAAGMRGMFEGVDSGKWTSVFQQSLAGRRPGVNVKSVVVTGLDNVDEAVGITTLLEVAGALRNVSGTWVGRLPALMEAFYIPMPSLKSRQSPFAFRTPLTLKSRVVFEIPESWTLMSKIPAQLQRKIPGLQWSSRWSSRDSKLHLDFSFHREARKYPASKYRAMEKTSLEGLITIGFDLALKGR